MQVLLEDMTDTDVQLAEKDVVNWKMKRKHYARQARLSNLPVQLNEILEQFAKAHDAVFRFSLRKLFRPIDFPQLRSWLDSLLEGLEQMRSDLAAMPDEEFLVALREYMAALADAMTKLRDICYRLALKAQDPSQYTASAYSADVSSYQASVARYQQIGQAVDVHWADWEAAQTQQHVGDDALATLVADLSESESRKLVDKGVVTEDQWREWRRLRTKGKQEDSGAASEEEKGP
jgi:hypothetical protein